MLDEKEWALGDQLELNSWVQYQYKSSLSVSTRLKFVSQKDISGSNPMIMAPVQTANPENYGGDELHIGFGANYDLSSLTSKQDVFGVEVLFPIVQNKNGLQMETKHQIVLGYNRSF